MPTSCMTVKRHIRSKGPGSYNGPCMTYMHALGQVFVWSGPRFKGTRCLQRCLHKHLTARTVGKINALLLASVPCDIRQQPLTLLDAHMQHTRHQCDAGT